MIIKLLSGALLMMTTLTAAVSVAAEAQRERPNIVVILLDDLGYADVGFMKNSEADIYTPSIDALAHEGTVFTQAYVSHPYCGPSRASLMTGRMPHTIGSQFNLADYTKQGVPTQETFFSNVLQNAGYKTGIVGKWHLGNEPQYRPNQRGFDYFYGMLGGGHVYHTKDFVSAKGFDPKNTNVWEYKTPLMENNEFASEKGYEKNLYITDMLTDAGIGFIERESTKKQPFFLLMSYNAPHTPEEAKAEDEQALKEILGDKAAKDPMRLTYTAMVYGVDRGVERIVKTLKEKNLYDNTLIVFLSDNGGRLNSANARNTPLRAGKTSTYEGGIRVPMFWHWPQGKLPGTNYKHVVSSLDLYPTLIALAGATPPTGKQLDGKNILADVRTNKNTRETEPLFFMMHQPDTGNNQAAVVLNNWKWFSNGDGNWSSYDLDKNIDELKTTSASKDTPPLIAALYDWTCEHIKPAWFDDKNYDWEVSWQENKMPNWKKTFPKQFKSDHCH